MKLTRCSSTTFACRSKTLLVKKEKAGTRPSTCLDSNEAAARHPFDRAWRLRSEEHTSELQSLMRISYAVFCLKKKKTIPISNTIPRQTHMPHLSRNNSKNKNDTYSQQPQ